ncbi:urea ABC transporter permease subunit UrtB [Mangrovimicrobium sediminis]|uniref:Urea ABC transporter permease subunit UrtB n=2 Tax=Mangrovimicrobium sediminis TaxID=2562682 RepID=A0A4Z0M5E8_9GAMM|nr:urea ABC transporter permease subunit UrtB [Haliea sp. SAOS-164]
MPGILERLEAAGGEQVVPLARALLEGDLYVLEASDALVIGRSTGGDGFALEDPLDGTALGEYTKADLKKLRVNNRVRVQLRGMLARLTLLAKDPAVRERAVRNMLERPDADSVQLLRDAVVNESNAGVAELQWLVIALYDIEHSEDPSVRLQALGHLDGRVEPEVRNALQALLAEGADTPPQLRRQAQTMLSALESKIAFYEFLETLFFGLSLGSVLLLIATGLAITFGVMGVINMAHGELIMLGAYTTYVVQLLMPDHIGLSILVAIPAAFIVSALVGVLIERGVIRFLHGRPLETLLATFGISLVLQQAVRTIFSPLNRQVSTPDWMSGSLEFNAVFSLTYNRLYVLLFAIAVFVVLQLILKKTPLGLQVRAVSQNRSMARSLGIRTEWVDAMTFGLGSGIAGLAGVALSQLTNVGPNLGQAYIIDSFMVVVFGGVGNLWGTLVGGFTLGVANKFLEPATGAVLAKILVLVFIILFIQKWPRGLFPQKGRAAE